MSAARSAATARCALCEGPARRRFVARGGHPVHRCEPCDLEFVWPTPTPEALAAVYQSGYFDDPTSGHGYEDYFGRGRREADEKARARCDVLERLARRPAGPWLDLGCADGRFVLEALRRGHDAYGVEPTETARAQCDATLRARVHRSLEEFDAASAPRERFAVVTVWDTLEHLPDPVATLEALRARLAPGALVGVVVPVIDNATARFLRGAWDQYKPPEHLWFFSRRALRALLCARLDAVCVYEAPAWQRDGRLLEATALPAHLPASLGRALLRVDRALGRAVARAPWVPPSWRCDAALLVVQTRSSTATAANPRAR